MRPSLAVAMVFLGLAPGGVDAASCPSAMPWASAFSVSSRLCQGHATQCGVGATVEMRPLELSSPGCYHGF